MPYLSGAVICDAARDYGGKVSILGGFVNIVHAPAFPIAAPIWFAGRVAFDAEEATRPHVILVRARSEAGETLAEVRGEFPRLDPSTLPVPDMPGVLISFSRCRSQSVTSVCIGWISWWTRCL